VYLLDSVVVELEAGKLLIAAAVPGRFEAVAASKSLSMVLRGDPWVPSVRRASTD